VSVPELNADSEANNPYPFFSKRNPAESSEKAFESGDGALARNRAVVNRMVDFKSVHPFSHVKKRLCPAFQPSWQLM
jgi:hypothetical protein